MLAGKSLPADAHRRGGRRQDPRARLDRVNNVLRNYILRTLPPGEGWGEGKTEARTDPSLRSGLPICPESKRNRILQGTVVFR